MNFKARLIQWLGGYNVPVESTGVPVVLKYMEVKYEPLELPLEIAEWEKLANMHSWGRSFFRYVAAELLELEKEERALAYGPERDRDRLACQVRRATLRDIQRTPEIFATKLARALEQREKEKAKSREKGLRNNGQ